MRGTTDGADCAVCPFSRHGGPGRCVPSEFPDNPLWVLVGEGPGRVEAQLGRPFLGNQGLIEKLLTKVGRDRADLALTTAYLCLPVEDADDALKEKAAKACRGRLQQELGGWPGVPVLTLGATAAKAVIPQEAIDAIDPPNVPKSKKRIQKDRAKAEAKEREAILKAQAKAQAKADKEADEVVSKVTKAEEDLAEKLLKEIIKKFRERTRERLMKPDPRTPYRKRKAPKKHVLDEYVELNYKGLEAQAKEQAAARCKVDRKIAEDRAAYLRANPLPPAPKAKKKKKAKFKLSDVVSTLFEVDVDGTGILRSVIPSIHPATLLAGGGASIAGSHTPDLAFVNLTFDALKVDALARGKDVRLRPEVETEVIDPDRTADLLLEVFSRARAAGKVAIDLETYVEDADRHHALMAYVAKIRTIGFAVGNYAVSVMWDNISPVVDAQLRHLLASDAVCKVFHNGLYDRTVLAANGYALAGPWDDTLLAHHAAFPGCSHRLQTVTSQFFAVPPWKSEFRNAEETPEGLTRYNALDTAATVAIHAPLQILVRRNQAEKVYALDLRMSEIASKMHLAGMHVDRGVNAQLKRTFLNNVIDSRRVVEQIAEDPKIREELTWQLAMIQAEVRRKGDPESAEERHALREAKLKKHGWTWKISSSSHIAALLRALGENLTARTESGRLSTKKDLLETLVHVPFVRDLLTYRENDKLYSTFVAGIFDTIVDGKVVRYGFADAQDRVHPIWNIHKISGRWAGVEPVTSNVPKDKWKGAEPPPGLAWMQDAYGKWHALDARGVPWRKDDKGKVSKQLRPNLRSQVTAPPGRVLVGFDFAQLEARIIALISGDPFLCATFADGLDIHRECARIVFPGFDDMGKDDQKKARDETKPLEYGAFYGGSVETLWKALVKEGRNVRLEDVARAVGRLMGKMEGVVRWQRDTIARAALPPYEVRDFILGRARTFPLGQVEPTEAINFGVQAAGASIMNTGMDRMDRALGKYREAFAIAQIHDAAVFECWEDDAEAIQADVIRCFTQEYERDGRMIPFPVEVAIGSSWAEV